MELYGVPYKMAYIYIYTCGFLVVGHRCGGSRDRWLYMEVVSVFLSYGGFDAQVWNRMVGWVAHKWQPYVGKIYHTWILC